MNSKFLKITLAIAALVFVSVVYLFLSGKTEQVKNGVVNITTENVFCRKNYTAEILKINDIDVVKRIIEIWKEKEGKCEFNFEGKNIGMAKKVSADGKIYNVVIYDKDDKEQSQDPFNQSVEQFEINLNNNTVSYQLQLDGSFFEIGKFKEETADWKTYKNEKYGFEMKYPDDYKAIDQLNDDGQLSIKPTGENEVPTLSIEFIYNQDKILLENDSLQRLYDINKYRKVIDEQVKVGGFEGRMIGNSGEKDTEENFYREVFIDLKEKILFIESVYFDDKILNQILSTFKFVD